MYGWAPSVGVKPVGWMDPVGCSGMKGGETLEGVEEFLPHCGFFPKEKHSFKIGGVLAIFWCFFYCFLVIWMGF